MTALIKNLTAMRDALEFYSNEENYIMPEKDGFILDSCAMEYDRGGAAKATLALFPDTLRMVQEMDDKIGELESELFLQNDTAMCFLQGVLNVNFIGDLTPEQQIEKMRIVADDGLMKLGWKSGLRRDLEPPQALTTEPKGE